MDGRDRSERAVVAVQIGAHRGEQQPVTEPRDPNVDHHRDERPNDHPRFSAPNAGRSARRELA